jgi:hypothetical protein
LRGDYSTALDQRDRVEIHLATNSVVYPPDYSGNPDPRNPIVPNGWQPSARARVPDSTTPASSAGHSRLSRARGLYSFPSAYLTRPRWNSLVLCRFGRSSM